ncbi:MAG: hypothetical protein ACJZ69_02075 [Pelagibacteraceae bacterium]
MNEEFNIKEIINSVEQILLDKKKIKNQKKFQNLKEQNIPFDTEKIIKEAENSLKK